MNIILGALILIVVGAVIWSAVRNRSRPIPSGEANPANTNTETIGKKTSGAVADLISDDTMTCPYCSSLLDKPPKQKKKCPHCGKIMYVSNRDGRVRLFTETEWGKYRTELKAISFRNRWLRDLGAYGVGEDEFAEAHQLFREKNNVSASDSDIIWGLFNEALLKQRRNYDRRMLYLAMSRFLYEEGRDHLKVARQASRLELKEFAKEECTKVEILVAADACGTCKSLSNRILTLEEATKQMPLPCEHCTHEPSTGGRGWCRCCYAPLSE